MHPQELNPYKPPDNAKKGVECTPLIKLLIIKFIK